MIKSDALLSFQRLSLDCIQVKEYKERYFLVAKQYAELMKAHPDDYAGLLFVVPSDTHPGMYALSDGHHRFVAAIMTGRADAWCVVIREPQRLAGEGESA